MVFLLPPRLTGSLPGAFSPPAQRLTRPSVDSRDTWNLAVKAAPNPYHEVSVRSSIGGHRIGAHRWIQDQSSCNTFNLPLQQIAPYARPRDHIHRAPQNHQDQWVQMLWQRRPQHSSHKQTGDYGNAEQRRSCSSAHLRWTQKGSTKLYRELPQPKSDTRTSNST